MTKDQLSELAPAIILGNTYHLGHRPGMTKLLPLIVPIFFEKRFLSLKKTIFFSQSCKKFSFRLENGGPLLSLIILRT